MDKKKETIPIDVGKRIDETKKEIAQLNEELEKLISSNVKKTTVSDFQKKLSIKKDISNNIPGETDLRYASTSSAFGKFNAKNSVVSSRGTMPSTRDVKYGTEPPCNKRLKSYDNKAAREFIRQQREKRDELRRQKNSKTKIELELKKQKLFELQQKSFALLQKNIQLSRERSKSKEKRQEIRMDRNAIVNKKGGLGIEKSINNSKVNTIVNSRKLHPKSCDNFKQGVPKIMQENPCAGNGRPFRKKGIILENCEPIIHQVPNSSGSPLRNITFRFENYPSNTLCKADQDLAATKIQAFYRGYRLRKQLNDSSKGKFHNSVRDSKETQTSSQLDMHTPPWLEAPTVLPYPCNFINAIRRKLQLVVNSPVKSRDIGIQSSIAETHNHISEHKNVEVQQKNEAVENHQVTQFRQELPNLDADALQHLALVHCENKSEPILNDFLKSDSDCDTSKNIPEISTESGVSSVQNENIIPTPQSNNNFLHINADRLKNFRLKIDQDRNRYPAIKDRHKYVLDINNEPGSSISKKTGTFCFNDNKNFLGNTQTEKSIVEPKEKTPISNKNDMTYIPRSSEWMQCDKNIRDDVSDEKEDSKFLKSPRDSILSFNKSSYDQHDNVNDQLYEHNKTSTESASSQEKKFPSSPRDSIISFNKSDYSEVMSSKSRQGHTSFTTPNDEIKTEKSDKIGEETNGSISERKSESNHIPWNSKFVGEHETASIDVIKTIEDSIDTSLISHLSDTSGSSNLSKYSSRRIRRLKSDLSEKHDNLLKKTEMSQESRNILLVDSSGSRTKKKSAYSTSDSGSKRGISRNSQTVTLNRSFSSNPLEKNHENESVENNTNKLSYWSSHNEDKFSNSDRSAEALVTEISCQKTDDSRHSNSNNNEFQSLCSSNFPGEKSSACVVKAPQDFHSVDKDRLQDDTYSGKHKKNHLNIPNLNENVSSDKKIVKEINSRVIHAKADMNQIHLKFEAEVHLLNDFNESLKQLMAVEKAFETIKNKNDTSSRNTSKNVSTITMSDDSRIATELSKSISTINITRGTFSNESHGSIFRKSFKSKNSSSAYEVMDEERSLNSSNANLSNNLAGLSIKMFEQLIKDEDVRIENLKTIIKIREQALLDRTKTELAWLEIQRKHLKETGKLQEASLVKKKQRGILLKHQQERREMQRLKQLQKIESNERKTILKEQRNLIKAKLSSEKLMSEFKIHTPRKQKSSSGPMRVLKSSESVHSETSISRKASDSGEIVSITSKSQSVRMSEIGSFSEILLHEGDRKMPDDGKDISNMKRVLLVRQAALMKRRKAVEDLLQRHQKLLEEEKKINELEMAANALIMQMPTSGTKLKAKADQFNRHDQTMGGFTDNEFSDDKMYNLTQSAYNRLHDKMEKYRSTPETPVQSASSSSIPFENIPESEHSMVQTDKQHNDHTETAGTTIQTKINSENVSHDYSEAFETDIPTMKSDVPDQNNLSSISELIEDFSKIEEGISMLSKQSDTLTLDESPSPNVLIDFVKESITEAKGTSTIVSTAASSGENVNLKQNSSDKDISTKNDTLEDLKGELTLNIDGISPESVNSSNIIPTKIDTLEDLEEELPHNIEEISSDSVNSSNFIPTKNDTLEDLKDELTLNVEEISPKSIDSSNKITDEIKVSIQKIPPDDVAISQKDSYAESFKQKESESKVATISENIISEKEAPLVISVECMANHDEVGSFIQKFPDCSVEHPKVTLLTDNASELSNSEMETNIQPLSSIVGNDLASDRKVSTDIQPEVSSEEDYDGLSNLFKLGVNSGVSSEKNTPDQSTLDISEKLPTDNDIDYDHDDSSSDNYSDDFEDDNNDNHLDEYDIEKLERIPGDTSSDAVKYKNKIEDAVVMVQIDLPTTQVKNEAKIIVINEIVSCEEKNLSNHVADETFIIQESDDEIHEDNELVTADTNSFVESRLEEGDLVSSDKSKSKVHQRVSEILANTVDSQKNLIEKTVNYQDYYVTTYEDITPINSPESGSPTKSNQLTSVNIFGNEAEELLKKQLAIEQEIKHLEQQQKEELPFVYIREIPNKPPPPYTPPSSINAPLSTILPATVEDLTEICKYSAKVLYNAYLSNNLNAVTFSETHFKSINETSCTQECCLFVFDLCREVAKSHYMRFEKEIVPCWLKVCEQSRFVGKPCGYPQLEKLINTKVKELLGFEKPNIKENAISKWSRKKKDHVDEILISELQAQEHEWLNYDKDELMVKHEVTNEIFDILLNDTMAVFKKIFS